MFNIKIRSVAYFYIKHMLSDLTKKRHGNAEWLKE